MGCHVIALILIPSCLIAGSVQADQICFPKTEPSASIVTMAPGWTSKEDAYNSLQLMPADRRTSIYLSMVLDQHHDHEQINLRGRAAPDRARLL
jgi:hypothetical protein